MSDRNSATRSIDYTRDQNWDSYESLDSDLCRKRESIQDCHIKERQGYKHFISDIRETFSVSSLSDCSKRCHERSAFCRAFSFRYNDYYSNGGGSSNCLLSNANPRGEYAPDSPWDVYEIINVGSFQCKNNAFIGGSTGGVIGGGYDGGSTGGILGGGYNGGSTGGNQGGSYYGGSTGDYIGSTGGTGGILGGGKNVN